MKWMLLEVFIALGLAAAIVFWTLPKKPNRQREQGDDGEKGE